MSILIKGMEIPKGKGEYALRMYVYSDGTAIIEGAYYRFEGEPFVAIPVPPHGRLGDLDALYKEAFRQSEKEEGYYNCLDAVISAYDIANAPTIIPAEEGE